MNRAGQNGRFVESIQLMHESLGHAPTPHNRFETYKTIIDAFTHAKNNNIKVLIETPELAQPSSVVIDIDYVGPRWCSGHATYQQLNDYDHVEMKIPYTISYADLYERVNINHKSKTKVVFEGENPFWNNETGFLQEVANG